MDVPVPVGINVRFTCGPFPREKQGYIRLKTKVLLIYCGKFYGMSIDELTVESEDVELEATLTEVQTPRAVTGKYGQKRITLATLEDETGEIPVTLWEEQIDAVKNSEGSTVRITGAYTRDWVGDLQLNIPRDGTINVVNDEDAE